MKTYWLGVVAITLADASVVTLLLLNDGGPESLVWASVLVVPLLVAALIVIGILSHLVLR
jgi:hypothetical protein